MGLVVNQRDYPKTFNMPVFSVFDVVNYLMTKDIAAWDYFRKEMDIYRSVNTKWQILKFDSKETRKIKRILNLECDEILLLY